jgi:16S rRNA (adenine1518-N6/adenine1519-N6)-dimethyltransferase
LTAYDPISPKQASDLLRAHGLRAQKRLGQNFLIDRNTLNRIVQAAELQPDEPVLEIGGGLGALTLALAAAANTVTCIEIDQHLEPILRDVTAGIPNIELIFADFLRLDLPALFNSAFGDRRGAVVANIPYYITTAILEKLLVNKDRLKRIVLLVQQEFARRMIAAPGTEEYGAMSVWVQFHAQVQLVGTVPRTVFLPSPDVDSAIIALTPVLPGTVSVRDAERFSHIVRAAFGQRRKTLLNALMRAPASYNLGFGMNDREQIESLLARAALDGNRRGETLSLDEFARLADA